MDQQNTGFSALPTVAAIAVLHAQALTPLAVDMAFHSLCRLEHVELLAAELRRLRPDLDGAIADHAGPPRQLATVRPSPHPWTWPEYWAFQWAMVYRDYAMAHNLLSLAIMRGLGVYPSR